MNKEDKELLLKYLCMALPYEVKVLYDNKVFDIDYISSLYEEVKLDISDNYTISISEIKPYLRPMSSMTDEERKEFDSISNEGFGKALDSQISGGSYLTVMGLEITASCNNIIYLLEHHFDFMGLITKNLAIKVTKDNNPYESNM